MKNRRNVVTGIAVSALMLFASGAFAKKHQSASRMDVGPEFASRAAEANLSEIRMADLAMTKTANPQVKNMAQRYEADHSKNLGQLKQIAAKNNMTLPNKMSAKDQAAYDRLSKLSGNEFDRAYTRQEIKDHKATIADFRREAAHGANPDLKQYASDTIPTLEQHLQIAEAAEHSASGGTR